MTYTLTPYRSLFSTQALRLMDDLFSWTGEPARGGVTETKDGVFRIELDVAGYKRNEIAIEVQQDLLIITAQNERRGKLTRSYWLPDLDAEKVTAKLEDGVLTINATRTLDSLPKKINVE